MGNTPCDRRDDDAARRIWSRADHWLGYQRIGAYAGGRQLGNDHQSPAGALALGRYTNGKCCPRFGAARHDPAWPNGFRKHDHRLEEVIGYERAGQL